MALAVFGGKSRKFWIPLLLLTTSAHANEAPSAPGNISATSVSSSEIRLSWDPSTDDRRVRNYQISRDGSAIATTGKTAFNDSGLEAETAYTYNIVASDGKLTSLISSYTVSTLAEGSGGEDPVSKPGKGKGPGKKPPTEEPPPEEPPVEEPPGSGAPSGWVLKFDENFDGSGDLQVGTTDSNWRYETMKDGLHRAGNTGIDALGNPTDSWNSVEGKRWSAWYDGYNAANAYRENDELVMGGFYSQINDPTRPIDYVDDGVPTAYGSGKLYTAWIDTFARKWTGPGDLHVMDPASPGKLFKYGYFETRVNFSEMRTPGFRLSMWLMPASSDAAGQDLLVSNAYDSDGNNGVELDLFEYEWINTDYQNRIQLSVLGGAAGSSSTNFDTSSLGIDIYQGYHTIGFLWESDKMIWTLDGQVMKEVVNPDLIPDVYSYLIVSREMNSGVKNPDLDNIDATDMLEEWPYIPRDPGLYAKNIWEFRDRINTDRAIVDYIRVWQPGSQ